MSHFNLWFNIHFNLAWNLSKARVKKRNSLKNVKHQSGKRHFGHQNVPFHIFCIKMWQVSEKWKHHEHDTPPPPCTRAPQGIVTLPTHRAEKWQSPKSTTQIWQNFTWNETWMVQCVCCSRVEWILYDKVYDVRLSAMNFTLRVRAVKILFSIRMKPIKSCFSYSVNLWPYIN